MYIVNNLVVFVIKILFLLYPTLVSISFDPIYLYAASFLCTIIQFSMFNNKLIQII